MGIVNHAPHAAAGDALATAELMRRYLDFDPDRDGWDARLAVPSALARRPAAPAQRPVGVMRQPAEYVADEPHFLERIATRAAPTATSQSAEEYFHLLGAVLLDRVISATEADALVDFATTIGLTRADCSALHDEYLAALIAAALEDDIITEDEHVDLACVADLLAIPVQRRDELIAEGKRRHAEQASSPARLPARIEPAARIEPGSRIVLTGQLSRPKESIAADLERAGFTVADSVSKKVALVIAADRTRCQAKPRRREPTGSPWWASGSSRTW